jgi:hypothetical protein
VFRRADAELAKIASLHGVVFTRYADDIVFSGKGEFPEALASEARSVIAEAGWKIAEPKVGLSVLPNRLKVHGLLVHGERPRLTKGYRNKIRAFEHLMRNQAIKPEDRARIKGHLSYARSVDKRSTAPPEEG